MFDEQQFRELKQGQRWAEEDITRVIESRSRCNLCSLFDSCDTGYIKVGSRGPGSPDVLVVGEAPGGEESRYGLAFIGPAAKHCLKLVNASNMNLESIRWTNVVRCFPHKQDFSPREPTLEEAAACCSYLYQEISDVKPKVIVTVGAFPTKVLLGDYSITMREVAGKLFHVEILGEVFNLVPSYHPSADLRTGGKYASSIMSAFALAQTCVEKKEVPVKHFTYNSTEDAIEFLDSLEVMYDAGEIQHVAFDIEYDTTVSEDKQKQAFELYDPTKRLVAASFAYNGTDGHCIPLDHVESKVDYDIVSKRLGEVISKVPVMVHGYVKAEGAWCQKKLGVTPNLYRDTMLMSFSLYMKQRSHGLKPLAMEFLSWPDWSSDGYAWFNSQPDEQRSYRFMPMDMMSRYSAIDPVATYKLWELFEPQLKQEGVFLSYVRRHNLSHVLCNIELRGARVDFELLKKISEEYPVRLKETLAHLRTFKEVVEYEKEIGKEYGPDSWQQVQDVLYGKLGAPIFDVNPKVDRRRGKSFQLPFQASAGDEKIPCSLGLEQKTVWVGNTGGDFCGERAGIAGSVDGNLILKKPLKFDHKAPIEIVNGLPSTDDKAILRLAERCKEYKDKGNANAEYLYDFLLAHRKYKKIGAAIKNFVKKFPRFIIPDTNILTFNYIIHATETGRLAARDMNVHSFTYKSDIRRLLISEWQDTGGLILSTDQSQLELRVLAAISGDETFTNIYYSCTKCEYIGTDSDDGVCKDCGSPLGRDMHSGTAATVFGKPYTEVTGDERRFCKTINFGIIYGMTADGLAPALNVTTEEAEAFITKFMKAFPGVKNWIAEQHTAFETQGYVLSPTGTKLYFKGADSEKASIRNAGKRESQNYPIQCSAGEMVLDSLIMIYEDIVESGRKSRPWETTHDSIVFDVYPGELLSVIDTTARIAEKDVRTLHPWMTVPLKIDMSIGARWDGDVSITKIEGSTLTVKGPREFYDETLEQLRKRHAVRSEILEEYEESPQDELAKKDAYKGGSGRRDGVKAIIEIQ